MIIALICYRLETVCWLGLYEIIPVFGSIGIVVFSLLQSAISGDAKRFAEPMRIHQPGPAVTAGRYSVLPKISRQLR